MKDLNTLQKEYNEIKDKYMKNHSPNLKEDLKNKLIELDYAFNKNYELELDTKFPMTTTLEKEETRLENLINFVELKSKEQKDLMSSYKKATDEVIELSYLKYSDNLKEYRERLNNVVKILALIEEARKEKNETKIKVIKNKLLKKEYLNLLYEFCLIDSLEVNDIDLSKEIDLKILVVTKEGHCYSSKEFSDYDILITASSFPYMNMAFKVNQKLRVFCVKDFRDCQAFTKMLFMTFSSDNIIDIDFYDVNMAFGMTATKPRVIKHFSYDDAKGVSGVLDSALVYVYTNEKDLF